MIHWSYTSRPFAIVQKEKTMVNEALGYWSQWRKWDHVAEVIHYGSYLPISYLEILYVHNEWILQYVRKRLRFIWKEGENEKNPPYAVATLSVMFIFDGNN